MDVVPKDHTRGARHARWWLIARHSWQDATMLWFEAYRPSRYGMFTPQSLHKFRKAPSQEEATAYFQSRMGPEVFALPASIIGMYRVLDACLEAGLLDDSVT